MASKDKSIAMIFDPAKKLKRIDFMNAIAGICQILHTDPTVKTIEIQISEKGKIKKTYPIKIV